MDTAEQTVTEEANDATSSEEARVAPLEEKASDHETAEATDVVPAADEDVNSNADGDADAKDATEHDASEPPVHVPSSDPEVATPPEGAESPESAPSTAQDPVCWICYETRADTSNGTQSTLVAPCKCNGSLRTVHQECLLAWMAQTNATCCPHCHHAYEVEDSYPSTLQRLCDDAWLPTIVAGLVCLALFYAFHRMWRSITHKRRGAGSTGGSPSASAFSSSRLMAMMGGSLPPHIMMLPQMGAQLGGGGFGLFGEGGTRASSRGMSLSSPSTLTGLLAELEVFALLVMVVYSGVRYLYQWQTELGARDGEPTMTSGENTLDSQTEMDMETVESEETLLHRATTAATASMDDLMTTVDDLWARTPSGSARMSQEEALCTLPFDVLTTLFYVVEHYCKRLQTWGVAKERVVRDWESTQNNLQSDE